MKGRQPIRVWVDGMEFPSIMDAHATGNHRGSSPHSGMI